MRLKSEIWISALVRRVFAAGGYAAIERRGAAEAGAIILRVRHRDGRQSMLAPAPQSIFETERPDERMFDLRLSHVDEESAARLLAGELSFDPDLWVVELEIDEPAEFVTIMPGGDA